MAQGCSLSLPGLHCGWRRRSTEQGRFGESLLNSESLLTLISSTFSALQPMIYIHCHDKRMKGAQETLFKAIAQAFTKHANQYLFTVCLRGTKAHKKCYLVSEVTKHFHEANEDCIAKGGTLAIPRNNDETNILRDYGKKSMPRVSEFWLGVNDMINEGKFVDVNGMALQYFNWDRAQPNGGKRENCVFFSQSSQGKWVDEVCRTAKRYICEFLIP
ncbi:c-type lectin domain family 3 member a [Limosa lapponica baueri]|uniref:C-type lectin domain family 3 member a n=1 Tax=Limosa lapponica baueri TaxID=1758121 RepID=A0A2I0TLL1_LIMLA|nr:c-type lectin domain family 3 member a [Limosa lapponica baueri]